MQIIAALRRHEKKLEKDIRKLQAELSGVRAATEALRKSAGKEIRAARKKSAKQVHKISREGRLAISRAAKKRWAKVRAQAKKVAG